MKSDALVSLHDLPPTISSRVTPASELNIRQATNSLATLSITPVAPVSAASGLAPSSASQSASRSLTTTQLQQAIKYASTINTLLRLPPEPCLIDPSYRDPIIMMAKRKGDSAATATPLSKSALKQKIDEHCRKWGGMSQEERNDWGGYQGYGIAQGLNQEYWRRLANNDGLREAGKNRHTVSHTTPPDYLTHLNHWQNMSQSERNACGGADPYGKRHQLNYRTWKTYTCDTGLTFAGKRRLLTPSDNKADYLPHLRIWRDMSPTEREKQGPAREYAGRHGLNEKTWVSYTNSSGLSPKGEQKLNARPVREKRDYSAHLAIWDKMTPEQRQAAGWCHGYAKTHNLGPLWDRIADEQGLRPEGIAKLQASMHGGKIDYLPHLRKWQRFSQQQRDATTVMGYAIEHKLEPRTWSGLVNIEGLKESGINRLSATGAKFATNFRHHCRIWRDMSQEERSRYGVENYASLNNLNINSWRNMVNLAGLKPLGQAKLAERTDNPEIGYYEHLQSWHAMPASEKEQIGFALGYAIRHDLNISTWKHYANNSGLSKLGHEMLQKFTLQANTDSPPAVSIKPDPDDDVSLWYQQYPFRVLPILMAPEDMTIARGEAQGPLRELLIHEDAATLELRDCPEELRENPLCYAAVRQQLRDQLRAAQQGTLQAMMQQNKPYAFYINEQQPELGMGLIAIRDIDPWTVLSPYGGFLYHTYKTILTASRESDHHFASYAFEVKSSVPAPKKGRWSKRARRPTTLIDGQLGASAMAYVNTAEVTADGKVLPSEKNNLTSIRAGENIIAYLTKRPVRKGETLLIDYNHLFRVNPHRPLIIKTEPQSTENSEAP